MPRPKKTRADAAATQHNCDSDDEDIISQSGSGSNATDAIFSNWSREECARLVDYIKTNGFDGDVKKLCEHFPGHTETNIRHFMAELSAKPLNPGGENNDNEILAGKFGILQEQARLNSLSQSYGSVLPTFIEWKALFDELPEPAEIGGIDYGEVYRTIAALMRGEIPRALERPTAVKLLSLIKKFIKRLKDEHHRPDVTVPQVYKNPVSSTIKTRQQCNVTLANRRSTSWSQSELAKAERLLAADLSEVRDVYLTPAWANPFRYPDEQSSPRRLKTCLRKRLRLETCRDEKKRGCPVDELDDDVQVAKKRRRRRK